MSALEHAHQPAVVGSVGAAGYTYTLFGFPMSDVIGWVTLAGLLISIIGNMPKAVRAVRDLFHRRKHE